jgi:glyoxylase-like metal-dependent hydrolase (beta-lactamase superfamily II)
MACARHRAARAESKFNEVANLMSGGAGSSVTLVPGVRRILAGNPGLMTGAGTNTYLLGERQVTVLDPGPDDDNHLHNILAAAGPAIRWVIVTHTHADHSPLAARLARESGARLIGLPPPADGRQDESFEPDELPIDDGALTLGDVVLTAIRTPGHASNCVCYLLAAHKLLFTGDHVLGGVSPVILPPDGDMTAYIRSLDKLMAYDFELIAPGHGELLPEGKRVVERLRVHRMQREAKVLRCLAAASTLDTLVPAVYDDVPAERHGWARFTLQAHLIKLVRESKVSERNGVWRIVGG